MYKLLVVDDEPRQVRALANIISQLRPGYEIQTACDGQEALEVLLNTPVDIVFTDIRMPNLDGLQLIERLYERGYTSKIVILSGYGEFEYAQKAIRFGVNDYLVKPISKTDLQDILSKVENALKDELEAKSREEELKKKLDNSLPVYLEHQLNKWVAGQVNKEEQVEIESIFPYKGYGLVLITVFRKTQNWPQESNSEFLQYAKYLMKESLDTLGHSISFFSRSDKCQMVTVLVSDRPLNHQSAENLRKIHQYIKTMKDKYNISATIGISEKTDNIFDGITDSFRSAQNSIDRRFYLGLEKVILDANGSANSNILPSGISLVENEISEAIRCKDKGRVSKITSGIFEKIKSKCDVRPRQLKEDLTYLLLNQANSVSNLLGSENYGALITEIKNKPLQCEEYSELWHFVNETLYKIIDITDDKSNDKNGILMDKCKKFIEESFMEDISLEIVAQKYFFNPSYFSNLFKSYVGIGFSEYLLKVRIQNAKQLLKDTGDSMADVAGKVGFRDPTYFNRVFKREVGISPLKYRQMNGNR
ncbi:MAG: response regulator [Clostridia bacterium]|nr:response regulator [Clostridia bacterium]